MSKDDSSIFSNDSWYDPATIFKIFSRVIYDLYARSLLEGLDFSYALATIGKGFADEIPSSSAHTPTDPHASCSYANKKETCDQSRRYRGNSGETHWEALRRYRVGEEQARCVRLPGPGFFHLSSEREAEVRRPRRKERTRARKRKKALTTKANMVVNERVASTFSVP